MVLGILTAVAAAPAIVGVNEAVQQGQRQNAREKHRGRKTNLIVNCSTTSRYGRGINGCEIILGEGKLYLALPTEEFPDGCPEDHPFTGYFLPYPERDWGKQGEGLVSTISDDPPMLNWIYVDRDTYEVKYGTRGESKAHIVGPWDVTKVDRRLTLEGWEGFMAVRYGPGEWALYFDRDDNGLRDILPPEYARVEVELVRKELKQRRPKKEVEERAEKAVKKENNPKDKVNINEDMKFYSMNKGKADVNADAKEIKKDDKKAENSQEEEEANGEKENSKGTRTEKEEGNKKATKEKGMKGEGTKDEVETSEPETRPENAEEEPLEQENAARNMAEDKSNTQSRRTSTSSANPTPNTPQNAPEETYNEPVTTESPISEKSDHGTSPTKDIAATNDMSTRMPSPAPPVKQKQKENTEDSKGEQTPKGESTAVKSPTKDEDKPKPSRENRKKPTKLAMRPK